MQRSIRQQYSRTYDELVFGKSLAAFVAESKQWLLSKESRPMPWERTNGTIYDKFVHETLGQSYDELVPDFPQKLIAAVCRQPLDDYRKKARRVFCAWHRGELQAMVVSSPKRGGAVKLGPIGGNPEMLSILVKDLEKFYSNMGRRRIYALIPGSEQETLARLMSCGYLYEGKLIEPYKASVDMVVLGKHWSE